MLGFFRRRPPVRNIDDLATFVDENAAFLVQKGIYEYSRARAGPFSKLLLQEQDFRESVERSRWQAFPLGLAMVGEMVDVTLQPKSEEARRALAALVLSVFDRYPVPASLDNDAWAAARAELASRLSHIGLHPPKRVMDIPEPYAEAYFSLMPIHESLRGRDFPTIRNFLRISLCNIHDELTQRMDAKAIMDQLGAHAGA